MGVTVFYKGVLKSPDLIDPLLDELKHLAEELGWEFCPFSDTDLNLSGAALQVHPEAESLDFYFNPQGRLVNIAEAIFRKEGRSNPAEDEIDALHLCWCKTQFAGPLVHKMVVELLVYLQEKYFTEMEITDEGGYYPDKDEKELLRRMQFLDAMIDAFGKMLETGEPPDDLPEAQKNSLRQAHRQLLQMLKFFANNPYLKETN